MNKLKLLLLILTTIATLNAIEITSQGYGNNIQDSKKEALSTLSNKISVDVKSDFKTYTSVLYSDYKKDTKKLIHLSSNLPLKGVVFYDDEEYDSIVTTATLSSKSSLNSYIVELERLNKNISQSAKQLKLIKDNNQKYNTLNQLLKDIENFNKHKIVATLLEGKQLPILNITLSKVKLDIQKLEDKIPSIKIASKLLTKNIHKSDIYISTIKPHGSSQVTQFAKILKDSILVTVSLSDINNNILETRTATLDKQAYKHTKYKPSTKTFDESLNSGFVKSGKLSVNIGFKGFSRADSIDPNDGYCVVNGKPSKVIVKTRGLNIKKKKFKIEKTEAIISFTSFGK